MSLPKDVKIEFLWALSECTSLQLQQLYTAAGLEMPTTNTIGVLIDLCPSTIPVAKMREWIADIKAEKVSIPSSDNGEAADKLGTKPAAAKDRMERPTSSAEQPRGAQSLSDLYEELVKPAASKQERPRAKRQRTSASLRTAESGVETPVGDVAVQGDERTSAVICHYFWYSPKASNEKPLVLPDLNVLSLQSALKHHAVWLWTYQRFSKLPKGVVVKDAAALLPSADFQRMLSLGGTKFDRTTLGPEGSVG